MSNGLKSVRHGREQEVQRLAEWRLLNDMHVTQAQDFDTDAERNGPPSVLCVRDESRPQRVALEVRTLLEHVRLGLDLSRQVLRHERRRLLRPKHDHRLLLILTSAGIQLGGDVDSRVAVHGFVAQLRLVLVVD